MERILDKIYGIVFEHCFGIMNYIDIYHHEHPLFRKMNSAGEQKTVEYDAVYAGDIILYSGGSFLDYIYLTEKYSPIFCTIAFDQSESDPHVFLSFLKKNQGSYNSIILVTKNFSFYGY